MKDKKTTSRKVLISVVVLNWNGVQFLKDCFDSIKNQTFRDFETILVDNASSDSSVEFAKKNYPFVKIIRNRENVGFAKANNIGFKESRGEWILALNNDTKLKENCLAEIAQTIARSKESRLGSICPKMLFFDGNNIDTLGHIISPSLLCIDCKDEKNIKKVIGPCGGAAIYSRLMLEDTSINNEYYDERYFIYNEDFDLNLRAKLYGWKTAYCKNAVVYHIHSATMKQSNKSIYLGNRNVIWTVIKDVPTLEMIIFGPLFLLTRIAVFFKYLFRMPGLIMKSNADALRGLNKAMTQRRTIQKHKNTKYILLKND